MFYFKDSAKFVVTKNNPDKIAAVKDEYKDVIKTQDVSFVCESTANAIALDLPVSDKSGWNVTSTENPAEIDMKLIHSYRRGKVPPNVGLQWEGNGGPREEDIEIPIRGGRRIRSIKLLCAPVAHSPLGRGNPDPPPECVQETQELNVRETEELRGTSTDAPAKSTAVPQQFIPSKTDKPTMNLLMNLPTGSGRAIKVMQRMTSQYRSLGINLLNDEYGVITKSIITADRNQPEDIVHTVLSRWLQGEGREPRNWATLITVLCEIELTTLADDIQNNLSNP